MALEKYYDTIGSLLVTQANFTPFPADVEFWEQIPMEIQREAVNKGEKYLNYNWGNIPALRYMDFKRNGNRDAYENLNFARRIALCCLTVAECVERKNRFIDDIINGIWCICEESSWVLPAHNGGLILPNVQKPSIDLFNAQTAASLALCVYLLKPQLKNVSSLIADRVEYEITRRVIDPFLKNEFHWMGGNHHIAASNWTAWCTSTCLTACLLTERDKKKRTEFTIKAMKILDYFIASYPEDGGCNEGAEYWYHAAGCMFDALEILYAATKGEVNIYDDPKIEAMGSYIYKVHMCGKYFANFADCSVSASKGGARTYLFGMKVKNSRLAAFGANDYLITNTKTMPETMNMIHKLMAMCNARAICSSQLGYQDFPKSSYYIDSLELLCVRNEIFQIAAKGGNNGDNHNHNDVGSFMVYYDNEPFLIDIGVETYSQSTFSSERYGIWTMRSAYHNLPTINGVMQSDGREFAAKDVSHDDTSITCDISGAYPPEAGVISWIRTVELADNNITVNEIYALESPTDDVTLSLMSWHKPIIKGDYILIDDVMIDYPPSLMATFEVIEIVDDAKLTPVWGDKVYRILLKFKAVSQNGEINLNIHRA
ncbi:MAG: heparinase II/III family protein [Oscillospiraceae bacterium]|nr:heparinase II/III family protein [Oscillospiraceae bacterium]